VPTINLNDDEIAAVAAALRRAIETDRFPRAPRLDPLRAALGKLEAAHEPVFKEHRRCVLGLAFTFMNRKPRGNPGDRPSGTASTSA
jgi:hypothetical protein